MSGTHEMSEIESRQQSKSEQDPRVSKTQE